MALPVLFVRLDCQRGSAFACQSVAFDDVLVDVNLCCLAAHDP